MESAKKVLLVEGDSDKSFFQKLCIGLDLDTVVQVATPKDLKGRRNSKEAVFHRLEGLLNQLHDGQITHIAVVVDADYPEYHGLGCQKTIERVATIVKQFDFELDSVSDDGLSFKHTDGFADFGLWVMPDNQQVGMLEDWVKACVKTDEQALFQTACLAVEGLDSPKFSPHLTAKAEVATWLAWQKQPGHGLYGAIKDDLLDHDSTLFCKMEHWLLRIFNQ